MAQKNHIFENQNIEQARTQFEKQGFLVIENAFDQGFCDEVKSFMDHFNPAEAQVNYGGSELRIYDAQKKNELLRDFFANCHRSTQALFGHSLTPQTLLAIRNKPIAADDTSLQKGRWHLDSFSKQIKVFLFLTETTEESGPFEFVPGSQKKFFKYKNLFSGRYIRPTDFLKKERRYQSLPDDYVESLSGQGLPARPLLCKPGTAMVVDTSAIHRARPCLKGERYALTAYYL